MSNTLALSHLSAQTASAPAVQLFMNVRRFIEFKGLPRSFLAYGSPEYHVIPA